MKSLLSISICAISIVSCAPALVQSSSVQQGATVRFRVPPVSAFRSGQVQTLTADSLILARCATCAGRLLYSRSEINTLEVMRPTAKSSRIGTGALVGLLIGGGLGYLSAVTCDRGDTCDLEVAAVPFGALAGALIGGIVGYLRSYKWEAVPSQR